MIRFTVLLFLLVAPQCLAKLKGIELPTLQSISSLSSSLAASSRNLVKFEPFSTHQGIQPDENFAVLVRFRLDEDWHIYGKEEKIGTPTRLELLSDEFVVLSQVLSSSRVHEFGSGDQKIVSHWLEDGSYLLATLKLRDDLVIPPKLKLRFAIIYQPCTATTCLRKMRKEIDVPLFVGKTSRAELQSWMQEITELQTFLNPQLEPEADQSGSSPDKILEEGAWMALFMAFLWGVAASLTPCVYPMIPITVSLFSEGATQPFLRRLGGAFSYVLGIAFVYATLGVIASHTGRDLGSWLANPYVAIALALLMVLLALSMFGLFELDLPNSMKERLNSVEGTTHFTLFLMGGAMGFVAAPCVGPFAGAIIIWLVKNPGSLFFGFLLMSAFGLGLGVLFLFVALFSQSILPRSGPWMIILKQVMGYILLGMALYFLEILVPVKLAQVAWGLYILCAGALMGAFVRLAWDDPWWKKISRAMGVLAFLYGAGLILQAQGFIHNSNLEMNSVTTVEKAIFEKHDEALKLGIEKSKPVFLYFSAKWCIPCKRIKQVVLKDPVIKAELERFIVGILDCTHSDSHGAKIKDEVYQSPSMPFFAFHDSRGKHVKRLDIHGAVEVKDLLNTLKSIQ